MKLLSFVSFPDSTGLLTPIEKDTVPFPIKRVFYLSDVPAGARRGGHAHHEMEEVVIAISGSFDVVTQGRQGKHRWSLNRADTGLYIEPGAWRYLCNFSTGAIALCLASTEYDPKDYIRDEAEFLAGLPMMDEDYFTRRGRLPYEEFVKLER
jgi:uncharacterized RmlC-like cupin family protein